MIAFIATIGLSARLELIRRGGVQVILLLTVASVGAVLQNLLGIGLAKLFGINPLVGIISGSVALTGGPATALAFGSTFEKMGVVGAPEMGLAAATFGIAVSGLVAGYIGSRLIQRNKLAPKSASDANADAKNSDDATLTPAIPEPHLGANALLYTVVLIAVSMGIGSLISTGLQRMGFILPNYIGAMIAAALIRNLNDKFKLIRISQQAINDCAVIALYLFIVMAVLTLRLWELAHLALPMLVMLCAQVRTLLADVRHDVFLHNGKGLSRRRNFQRFLRIHAGHHRQRHRLHARTGREVRRRSRSVSWLCRLSARS